MTVIDEIASERQYQIDVKGWTTEHDDGHDSGQMARAAACYCHPAFVEMPVSDNGPPRRGRTPLRRGAPNLPWLRWPWEAKWWKPKNPRRDLIRAAALIVAEIERLDRKDHP